MREDDPPLGEYKRTQNFAFSATLDGKPAIQAYVNHEDARARMAELVFWLRDHEKEVMTCPMET